MLKKYSVFFEKGLQKRIDLDDKFMKTPMMVAAIKLPIEVLVLISDSPIYGPPYKTPHAHDGAKKLFHTGWSRNKMLVGVLKRSSRMQVFMQQWVEDSIRIVITFFERGKKGSICKLEAHITQDGKVWIPMVSE